MATLTTAASSSLRHSATTASSSWTARAAAVPLPHRRGPVVVVNVAGGQRGGSLLLPLLPSASSPSSTLLSAFRRFVLRGGSVVSNNSNNNNCLHQQLSCFSTSPVRGSEHVLLPLHGNSSAFRRSAAAPTCAMAGGKGGFSKLSLRGTPKYEQKTLGAYPIAPEHELVWKNRMISYGGHIQQTISPFQMKIVYPYWHTFPARVWAKFSAYWWWWIWPGIVFYGIMKKMFHDAEESVKDKYWY